MKKVVWETWSVHAFWKKVEKNDLNCNVLYTPPKSP
jgi:hypothetical protein